MEIGAVIRIGRRRGLVHDAICGPDLAEIDELAGEDATLAPPFVSVLTLQILGRSGENQFDGCRNVSFGRHNAAADIRARRVVAQQPVHTAQRVTQITARVAADRVQQRAALGGFRLRGAAGLDDRNVVVANAFGGARRGAKILGADAPVHARHMVGTGQHARKCREHGRFHFGRQWRRPPRRANLALGGGAVALPHLDTGERKPAGGAGRVIADESAHRDGVGPRLPQLLLGAPAYERNARPVGIGTDEGGVPFQSGLGIRTAQQRPFDDFLRQRIAGGCRPRSRLTHLILTRELNRLFRRSEIGRQRCCRIGGCRPVDGEGDRVRALAFTCASTWPHACAPLRFRCRTSAFVALRLGVMLRLGGLSRLLRRVLMARRRDCERGCERDCGQRQQPHRGTAPPSRRPLLTGGTRVPAANRSGISSIHSQPRGTNVSSLPPRCAVDATATLA